MLASRHNQTVVIEDNEQEDVVPPTPKDSVLNSRKGGYPFTTSERSMPISTIGHEQRVMLLKEQVYIQGLSRGVLRSKGRLNSKDKK